MLDESLLRERARETIRRRKLPSRRADRTVSGPGVGAACSVCGRRVTRDQIGYVMEFAYDAHVPERYDVHFNCYVAWEFERAGDGSSTVSSFPAT
jgi:hypothetical protein